MQIIFKMVSADVGDSREKYSSSHSLQDVIDSVIEKGTGREMPAAWLESTPCKSDALRDSLCGAGVGMHKLLRR